MFPLIDRAGSLSRNSFWLLLARVTAQGLNVLFVAFAARRLGVSIFGEFTVIASLVILGNTFTTFGTETLLIREIAKAGRITQLAARAFGLQLTLSGIWWLATLTLDPNPALLIYSLSLLPLALFSVASALLRAFERMDLYWTLSLANGILQCVAILFSSDLWTLCLALLISQALVAFLAYWICSASLPHFYLIPSINFYPLLRVALPFAAMTTLSVLTQRLGIFSLSALAGETATGLFASAVRTVEALKFGHYAILGALLPILSRGSSESKKDFRYGLQIMLAISALLAGGVVLLADPLVFFLFGEGFEPAIRPLSMLAWTLIPYTISAFLSVDMVSRGMEYTLVKTMLVTLAIYALLYTWLIPMAGITGAIWTSLLGELVQSMILVFVARRKAGIVQTAHRLGKEKSNDIF